MAWNFNRLELDPSFERTPKQQAALALVRIAEKAIAQPVMTPAEKAETSTLLDTARDYLAERTENDG